MSFEAGQSDRRLTSRKTELSMMIVSQRLSSFWPVSRCSELVGSGLDINDIMRVANID